MPCKIIEVKKGSIAHELGILPNCELLTMNGKKLRDYIDYRYYVMNEELDIEIKSENGEINIYSIEKDLDEDLGLIFESAVFDRIKPCANNCIFCFVDQQPKGLRNSLYIKDDDYRLSYLQGTYITLTNLTKKDRERISSLHLGPLYISIHTTNLDLRVKMLRNKNAANLLKELDFLNENEIPIHTQIVLCPNYNDGIELEKTLNDLWKYKKILCSIAVVPLGLTKYREENLTAVSKEKAIETIEIIENFNKKIKKKIANVSDEFFLIAEREIPSKKYYNKYVQIDDGVGSLRTLIDDFEKRIKKSPKNVKSKKTFTICTSQAAKEVFSFFCEELNKIENIKINLRVITSDFWGEKITVAGLITGSDLIENLKNNCDKDILIPSIMIRPYTTEFLDGLQIKDVEKAIKAKLHIIRNIYSTKEIFDYIFKR